MGYYDVVIGQQSLSDYFTGRDVVAGFDRALQRRSGDLALQVGILQRDQQRVLASGLGALGESISSMSGDIAISLDSIADGIDKLNADFNLLMGDVIWKLEMQQETLNDILREIRTAEFEREAREYRNRGEDSYLNGWYEDALKDFLAAEQRNYKDFSVLRSIGNIYFYPIFRITRL